MKEKKTILAVLIFTVLFVFSSCSPEFQLKGTWKATDSDGDSYQITFDGSGGMTMTVRSYSSSSGSYNTQSISGSYAVSGSIVALSIPVSGIGGGVGIYKSELFKDATFDVMGMTFTKDH